MKKQTGSVAGYRLSVFGHRWGLSMFSLLTLLLLAGSAQAATIDWVGGTSTNMSTAANWSPANVPGTVDIARWNSSIYTYQPSLSNAMTIGQLLFDAGNSSPVTNGGSSALTLSRIEGVGIQMTNGAVTINAPITLGNSLSFINNNPSPGNALTLTSALSGAKRLTVSGSGDTIVSDLTGGGTLTMNGTGTLTLSGSANNNQTMTLVNSGTVKFNKGGTANALAGTSQALIIGGANATPATVQYTGASTNMIGSSSWVTILGGGWLDLNGGTQYQVANLAINSMGAGGDTTPIMNSGSGGTRYLPSTSILTRPGYTTTLDSGSGTNVLNGSTLTFYIAGSYGGLSRDGRGQITGKLKLLSKPTFTAYNSDAADDLTINAAISGAAGVGFDVNGTGTSGNNATPSGRVVLTGDNSGFSGPVTLSTAATVLNIRHGNALGTNLTTVASGASLELQNNIAVGAQLSLSGAGYPTIGALRNVSGDNSWNGPITQTAASRINSDSGTLTLTNTVSLATVALTVGGLGNVTMSTNCIITSTTVGGTLTKDGAGILTLSGTNTFTGATTVKGGTLVLDYASGNNSKLADGAALYLYKGTLILSGGNHTEVVTSTTLGTTGGGHFSITNSGGSSVLNMKAITRTAGSTIDFAADNMAQTTSANNNGILGGWATVAGLGWATSNSTGIAALPIGSYVANGAGTTNSISPLTTDNVDMTSDTTLTNSDRVQTLRFNAANVGRTLSLSNNATLTVGVDSSAMGGILVTTNVGPYDTTITNGTLSFATHGHYAIHQYNTNGALVIYSTLAAVGNCALTMTGPGRLVLGGSGTNTSGANLDVYVNGGALELNKPGAAVALPGYNLYINQRGIVKYTGDSTNMIADGCVIIINENGQLDFNGKSDKIGNVFIGTDSSPNPLRGASGSTTPIVNSGSGGNLTMGTLAIAPLTGYETLINSGTGTNTLTGNVTFVPVGSGTARISGNLALGANITITVPDGEALDDLVIDAVISGSGTLSLGDKYNGHLVLGGANTFTNTVTLTAPAGTLNGGYVTITNGSALGTADGGTVVQTGTSYGNTLELRGGNITVAAEPLTLSGMGQVVVYGTGTSDKTGAGALRSYSGNNTWGGPVTLGATARISSDLGSLLTLANTVSGAGFGLNVAGLGDVTINGAISNVSGLTNDCLGTLTLGGAVANAIVSTVVNSGTVLLNKTSGAAVSNLTVNGGPSPLNGTYGLVRYAANSGNPMISGTVTLNANQQGAGQLDFNGSTDTVAVVTINSTGAIADSRPIVNTGNGGLLTINALNITPVAEYITKLDSGTNGVLRLGGDVTFTNAGTGQATISGILDLGGATRTFNVGVGTAGTGPIYDLGISAVITNGALTKIGTGRLYLSGASTYAGATLINAGTLEVAATGSITNVPTVTVAAGAILQTDSTNALGANAVVDLNSSGSTYGKANLNFVGTQTVAGVRLAGILRSGTWGSTNSTAANKSNDWFTSTGTGVLNVNGPVITNCAVSNVTSGAADFNGGLGSAGAAVTVGVLWGTTDGGLTGAWDNVNWFPLTYTSGAFTTNISPLASGTTYFYTYVASNDQGVVRAGPSQSFMAGGKTWYGASADWGTADNWIPSGVPTLTDDVNIPASPLGGNQPLLNLATGPVTNKSLTLYGTLTVTNGNVDTKILNVVGDVLIASGATVTHAADWSTNTTVGSESNRLYMSIGGNLTIAAAGQINVDLKGYQGQRRGPGYGIGTGGGGHGGEGSGAASGNGTTYGSVTNPVNSGSSGGRGTGSQLEGLGGGTVVLRVTGSVSHNGVITANGGLHPTLPYTGGAGGTINLTAAAISGVGALNARGGSSGGGGGRIALRITGGGTVPSTIYTNISAIGSMSAPYGGAGTIYIVDAQQTNLIVNNNNTATTYPMTPLRDGVYQFPSIILTNNGVLAVGTNATLNLDGCTLVTAGSTTNKIMSRLIVRDNGQLTWSGTLTNSAVISFKGSNTTVTGASLVITNGGILTHEGPTTTGGNNGDNRINLTLSGDLTVANNGTIWVKGLGYYMTGPGYPTANAGGGSHGGQGATNGSALGMTYGSITNPVTAGSGGYGGGAGRNYGVGGGVAIIRAANVTVNGLVHAGSESTDQDYSSSGVSPFAGASSGAGGSVNIQAGTLQGTGRIVTDGADGSNCSGGGGRIAVVLTNAATFGNVAMSAAGGGSTSKGAAGTIYLQGTNQAYGLLIVSNNQTGVSVTTLISTQVTDTVVGDVQLLGTANVSLVSNMTLTVYGSWSNAVATNAISGGTVELAGAAPASVWGGNTWSNLTITTAGKVVSFQTNVIQYVLGAPIWSNNVTLTAINPTSTNTRWILTKPGTGFTQDVGRVTVGYSDASGGVPFRGAVGSTELLGRNASGNVNWIFIASNGSVFLLR